MRPETRIVNFPEPTKYEHAKALELRFFVALSKLADPDKDATEHRAVWQERLQNQQLRIRVATLGIKAVGFAVLDAENGNLVDYFMQPQAEAEGLGMKLLEKLGYQPPAPVISLPPPDVQAVEVVA